MVSRMVRSLLAAAVGAQDVVALGEETAAHQRHGALHAGETLAVPLPLLKGHILRSRQTGDGFGTAHTFLGIQVAKAIQAVGVVLSGGEALPCQLPLTANAGKALAVPRLILVSDPTSGNGFFAGTALVGELLLETGNAVVAVFFGDEGLGSYWLLAALTQEARLVPAVPLVLHFSGAWHDGLLAGGAL